MNLASVTGGVTEADWDRFKETIRDLYLVQGKNLLGDGSVQQIMEQKYNFKQT
jgi:hypothetical protein